MLYLVDKLTWDMLPRRGFISWEFLPSGEFCSHINVMANENKLIPVISDDMAEVFYRICGFRVKPINKKISLKVDDRIALISLGDIKPSVAKGMQMWALNTAEENNVIKFIIASIVGSCR